MSILSIVPRLPPAIDGVGDYALRLAQQLTTDFGSPTRFVVGDPTCQPTDAIAAVVVAERSRAALLNALDRAAAPTLLLHYVGHGYANRGCAVWLVEALEQWKQAHPQTQLVTMFHELYAVGVPWKPDFWLSLVQQQLAARVARLSDRALTSTQRYAKTLDRLSRGKHAQVPTLPIFSNVGEPTAIRPLADRQPRLVIFGQTHTKRGVYRQCLPSVAAACQALNLTEIWDLGPSTGLAPATVQGIPVREQGARSAAEISDILATSAAGFLHYDPTRLAKSGVFAAYCAHGLLPVSSQSHPHIMDGLRVGVHYWVTGAPSAPAAEIAQQAHCWYRTHNLAAQAQTFAAAIALRSNLI